MNDTGKQKGIFPQDNPGWFCQFAHMYFSGLLLVLSVVLFHSTAFAQTTPVPGPITLDAAVTGSVSTSTPGSGPASGRTVHLFTGNGTLTPPPGLSTLDVLVIGGGGGGGTADSGFFGLTASGGGGGAGRFIESTIGINGNTANITVGTGGQGGTGRNAGTSGGSSSFSQLNTITAAGGGGGGGYSSVNGSSGGSGGGGGSNFSSSGSGGGNSGGSGFGANGGNGRSASFFSSGNNAGGGGGGAGGAGQSSPSNGSAGDGGNGRTSTFFGGTFAGGGGGGANSPGDGGSGGAGDGSQNSNAEDGSPNTGSGGGGSRGGNGGGGGSGRVQVRYYSPLMSLTQQPQAVVPSGAVISSGPQVTVLSGAPGNAPISGVPVTVSIQDSVGSPSLTGTLTVNTNASGVANFNNITITGDAGQYSLRFTVGGASDNFLISNQFTVNQDYFTIEHASSFGLCVDETLITITVRDAAGDPVEDYTGTVTLSNSGLHGSYTVEAGQNSVSNPSAGVAQYTFADADDGVVVLAYSTNTAGTITFDANDAVNEIATRDYALSMEIGACSVTITHNGTGGSCSVNGITLGVIDSAGNPAIGYTGIVTISSDPSTGNWTNPLGGQGTLTNGGGNDGEASYEFHVDDNAEVVLGYQNSTGGTYSFDATTSDSLSVSQNSGDLELSASCQFRIQHGGNSSICSIEEITISVTDANGDVITGFTGLMNLSTAGVTGGNWSKTGTASDAFGTLNPGSIDTGAASYFFTPDDQGTITLQFADDTAETVNFNLVASGVNQPSGQYDPDLVIGECIFRITHTGTTDVCSLAQVTVALYDFDGSPANNYTGTVNLSTSTGEGTWQSISSGSGTLNDPFAEDGSASYTFDLSDNGSATFNFTHSGSTGPVNFNASDSISTDPQDSGDQYDANLEVESCSVRISHGLNSNACAVTPVTFAVYDRNDNLATNYTGTLRISNNTGYGDWVQPGGAQGTLTAPTGADTGIADYAFDAGDNGSVTLNFRSQVTGTINFDADDDGIEEDGAYDPDLFYSSCFPQIFDGPSCTNNGTSTSVAIPAENSDPALRSRVVIMATMQIGNSTTNTTATFAGQAMTRVHRERNNNSQRATTEIWAILDDDLPNGAGTYNGQFNNGVGSPSICLLSVTGVAQEIPQPNATTPANGPVNGSTYTGSRVNGVHPSVTNITTNKNNAFVVSAITNNDTSNDANSYFFGAVQPAITMEDLWGGPQPSVQNNPPYRENNLAANPTGGKTAGSAGVLASMGLLEVSEPFRSGLGGPSINAHAVVAFNPLVTGEPLADGFVPVLLYETYAGRVNYRAIGNSMRDTPSSTQLTVNASLDCSMVNPATGSSATLNLPVGSQMKSAFLYWTGSGTQAQADNEVTFGPTGSEVNVVAEDVFIIEDVTDVSADFFAGFADVTDIVTSTGNYTLKNLSVQTGAPWNSNGTCAGGWSLIAIFEHPNEHVRVINLFHGFQPFQYSAFTLVPRNFRMATYDPSLLKPNGQVTHFTVEGDEQLFNGDESLGIQTAPGSTSFSTLPNSFNPDGREFNSTITRPIYTLAPSNFLEFDSTAGPNNDGYELDFPVSPGQQDNGGDRIGATWGIDVDTHYLSHTRLEDFGQVGNEAERITTRYSAGQDLVMLVSEVVAFTNYPIADIEVFITDSSPFKVGETGEYYINVRNNGNSSGTDDEATGEIIVTQRLPDGMTLANAGSVGGAGWTCSNVSLDPGAFTCVYDLTTLPGGQLDGGDSLPLLTVEVEVGEPPTYFPLQSNTEKATVRVLHSGGNCTVPAAGISPDPATCDRVPQFDNRNDLQNGGVDINDLENKTDNNNNVASINTVIEGRFTNLRMAKQVATILESGESAQYLLTVTNLGPDATTTPFTLSDAEPTGVDFVSASGSDWNCSTTSPTLNCTYSGTLAMNASTTLTLNVDVTGGIGFNVSNTAQVTAGAYNFDRFPGNNSATDSTEIVGPPVASQEKFLLSVSDLSDSTTIGGLGPFSNDDLVIYDPATDTAEMYFDNSALGFGVDDANAVHLLKNGHIVLSASAASSIGQNNVSFGPADLVRYDPISGQAEMFLQGSTVFSNPASVNINSVYVMDDCDGDEGHGTCSVLVSTTTGGTVGSNNLSFTASDVVRIWRSGPNAGQAEIYLDGSDGDVFGPAEGAGNVDVDAFYVRVDGSDATETIQNFALSTSNTTTTIGSGLDPVTGTLFTRDDVVQLDLENTPNSTSNLFVGDQALGIFQNTSNDRRLDALHVVEDGYIGHFSISQVQSGSVCEAGVLRITKHEGLSHDVDTDYYGSIRLSTSTGEGIWQLQNGSGVLTNFGGANDGQAIYRFVAADQGDVELRLAHGSSATVSVNVTNGVARELGSEDPSFIYNEVLTPITFADLFTTAAFNNNDGTLNFEDVWQEVDGITGAGTGLGANAGNVQVVNGSLQLTSSTTAANNSIEPSLSRVIDLDPMNLPYTEDVWLKFHYGHNALAFSDSFVVEARGSSSDSWVTLQNFTGITVDNTNTAILAEYNITTALGNASQSFSDTTEIRFRINEGYELDRKFFIRDVTVETATDQCGYSAVGQIDHYSISHSGTGISCVGIPVTITGHDSVHGVYASGESVNLTTSTTKGTWSRILQGSGTLTSVSAQGDNGAATYTFPPGESSVTLLFNHTVEAQVPDLVNVNVAGVTSGAIEVEDPDMTIVEAGFAFYNETQGDYQIRTQIAGKPSSTDPRGDLIALQAVRSSDNDPLQCAPLFDAGQTLEVELAAECSDPAACAAGTSFSVNGENISVVNSNSAANAAAYTPVTLDFIIQPSGDPGATIVTNYSDVGVMQLHARYNIPFGFFGDTNPVIGGAIVPDDPTSELSDDYMYGSSNTFVVRPFALSVDFESGDGPIVADRDTGTNQSVAADEDGSLYRKAGENFAALVSSVAWQAADDCNLDGQPDDGSEVDGMSQSCDEADLLDNPVTPSFYRDSQGLLNAYRIKLDVVSNQAENDGGVRGVLDSDILNRSNFANYGVDGVGRLETNYNEVGIIDIDAELVDFSEDPTTYLSTDAVIGRAKDVGRFYPERFDIVNVSLTPRVEASCSPPSTFTYMGEPFGLNIELVARNVQGQTTENYRAGFAKLDEYDDLNLKAIEEVTGNDNNDLTVRLSNDTMPATYQAQWSAVNGGELELEGNVIFERANPADPDGPFEDLIIAFVPTDSDGVTLAASDLDTEITEGDEDYSEIARHDYYYGRLIVDNAYGPETENLPITFRVEYFDGERFVINTADDCTIISAAELDLLPGTYTSDLDSGETSIVTPGAPEFNNGLVNGTESASNPTDAPMTATAPGEGNSGTVDVELDLDALGLPFLRYSWPHEGNDYDDNPRARLEFGVFRNHDRLINWQEVYNGATP